jgi:uncharacterized membrane protein YebE (DUF533 family)
MEIERPNANPLTPEDLHDLEKLKAVVERAIADGKLTKAEMDAIRVQIHSNGKVMVEELELCRELMAEKVRSGALIIEWEIG